MRFPNKRVVYRTSRSPFRNRAHSSWHSTIHRLSQRLEQAQITEYVQLLQRPFRMISLNLLFGIARGIGIALGLTIFTTLVVWFLNWLGALELPIIGDFIADLVEAVQQQLENRRF